MIPQDGSRRSGLAAESGTFKRQKITYVARRVIVKLAAPKDDVSLADVVDRVLTATASDGARALTPVGKTGRLVLELPESDNVLTVAKRLSLDAGVEYAEPDVIDHAQIVPNDTRYAQQWSPGVVNAEAAWDLETGGGNVVIGIIDSGISMTGNALDHPDLNDASRITLGTDFVDGGTPRDGNAHGTHVAGIAAGAGNNAAGIAGMNWQSPVYICRTLDNNGSGSSADFADAVEEITDHAVANGLKAVINYSGGGAHNQTKQDACQYASDHGMLVVAAAGNDNGGPVIWPAAYSLTIPGVIAVGSTDSNDTVSSFSNVGPEITVVAPGRDILSSTPTYVVDPNVTVNFDEFNGTSMATPLVTGLAALMWSRHPSHTAAKIKQCLQDTAVKLGSGSFDNAWGHGRVDALAALRCGDLIFVPSSINVTCQPSTLQICEIKTRIAVTCLPKSAICPRTSVSNSCPTRLPVLCPTTGLQGCWSRLLCVEPKTTLAACVIEVRTNICPSAVDACPSAPGGCEPGIIDVNPVINPAVEAGIIGRIGALERRLDELSSGGAEASADEPDGWFYVDDDGNAHEI
jgi:subtilisin family serine protease